MFVSLRLTGIDAPIIVTLGRKEPERAGPVLSDLRRGHTRDLPRGGDSVTTSRPFRPGAAACNRCTVFFTQTISEGGVRQGH